jgi:hypothetical protein
MLAGDHYASTMANGKSRMGSWLWCAVSGAVGVAVGIIISQVGQRREAWDSPYYWTFGVPALIAGALVSGFFARRNRLAIGYAPFLGQLITMVIRTGVGSMLPLGIVFKQSCSGAFPGSNLIKPERRHGVPMNVAELSGKLRTTLV